MPNHKDYFKHVNTLLENLIEQEEKNIDRAIDLLFDATINKNNLFSFGAGHASMLPQEFTYRAGGIATINPIFESNLMLHTTPLTFTSQVERLNDYGKLIANKTPIQKNDVVIVHSVSGRNTVMIDFVNTVKEKGAKVIAITNLTYSKSIKSRHPSGKRLFEISDIVIDNHGDVGDAAIKLDGLKQKVGPTSTVIASTIANAMVVGLTQKLINAGEEVPVMYSANLDEGDEHNAKIFKTFKDNIFYL